MSNPDDLLSMADIARMTGQSRSTVGNWKARNADFPVPASRTTRGPLYDPHEIESWLQRTGRSKQPPTRGTSAVTPALSGDTPDVEYVDAALVFLALRKFSAPEQWERLVELTQAHEMTAVNTIVESVIPVASELVDWRHRTPPARQLEAIVEQVSRLDPNDAAEAADDLLYRCSISESRNLRSTQAAFENAVAVPPVIRELMIALLSATADEPRPAKTSPNATSCYQAGPGLAQVISQMAQPGRHFMGDIYLQEPTHQGALIAQLHLALHGLTANAASGDVLAADAFPELRASHVICTPPWDQKLNPLAETVGDPRWVWGEPGTNDAFLAWVQHCLYHLADGGRAVILLPSAVLADRGRSAKMRRRIVKAGLLEGVISLPSGAIPGKSSRGTLLVFSKSRNPSEGTVMIDLSIPADASSTSSVVLNPALVKQTLAAYHQAGMPGESVNTEWAHFEDIAANDFVLDPARYQTVTQQLDSHEQLYYRYSTLKYQLETLLSASSQADQRLRTVLEIGS